MAESTQSSIETKVTYNTDKRVPRNFFLHYYQVTLDGVVHVLDREQEMPVSANTDGYVTARFRVAPDATVHATITHQDNVLLTGKYLIHDEDIFVGAFNQSSGLHSVARGIFGDKGY